MKATKVNQLMIPLSDYACVTETDNLGTAIKTLKKAQADPRFKYKHRSVLVCTPDDQVIGKVGLKEIIKALEPKYRHFENPDYSGFADLSRFGFNVDFLHSLVDKFSLWDESIEELVAKASKRKVKDVMYTPSQGEYVKINAPIAEAIHQFILGGHQGLLVVDNDKVVGIVRLADVFELICEHVE